MDAPTLFVPPKDSQTGDTVLSTQYVLRQCNKDFMSIVGMEDDGTLPELLCVKTPGKIAPLRTFDNTHGHWHDGTTRVFRPQRFDTLDDMVVHLTDKIEASRKAHHLWDMDGIVTVTRDDVESHPDKFHKDFVTVSLHQMNHPYSPISVHTAQAYVESEKKRGKDHTIFGLISQSTVVTGMHGGLHNNQSVEMGFEEKKGSKDSVKRTYNEEWLGFICAGHNAHSGDAGKSRRVASYTRARVIHTSILDPIKGIDKISQMPRDWILYCMGMTCRVDEECIWEIVHTLNEESRQYFTNQFLELKSQRKYCPATYMVYEDKKILYLSVSSGVLLRVLPGNVMIDSHMVNFQAPNSVIEHPKLPKKGRAAFDYNFSSFFHMAPFADQDRPPRGLFSSGQTTQAQFFPWSAATARVAPLHASRPIVGTKFIRDVEEDHENNPDALWDIFPGEDLLVCYMNTPENFEDSMMLSSAFADRGAFSSLSLCTYRISDSEKLPEVGEKLCGKKYKWWKVDCTDSCVCKLKDGGKFTSTSGRVPSGRVHQIIRTEDGSISIKVLSFSQIITGDKVSTMHGQKGVVHIVPEVDLPVIVLKNGSTFKADIYIAVGSIVSRQTNGQIYESAYGSTLR